MEKTEVKEMINGIVEAGKIVRKINSKLNSIKEDYEKELEDLQDQLKTRFIKENSEVLKDLQNQLNAELAVVPEAEKRSVFAIDPIMMLYSCVQKVSNLIEAELNE